MSSTSSAAIGLVLGIAIVWWVRPDTNAGAIFIVIGVSAFCLAVGVIMTFLAGLFRRHDRTAP